MRGLILATQFLTRLPTPQLRDFDAGELSRSAIWFPVVGALVGLVAAAGGQLGAQVDPWLAGLAAMLLWLWVTGGLHADGLCDLTDGLAAAHRDPARLLAVMKEPTVGAFGVMALVALLLGKTILLMLWAKTAIDWLWLPLLAGWARWGAMVWAKALPPLAQGSGERFAWDLHWWQIAPLGLLLAALSLLYAPPLLAAPLLVALWLLFLQRRLGGSCGDALGAGIELVECGLLLAAVLAG